MREIFDPRGTMKTVADHAETLDAVERDWELSRQLLDLAACGEGPQRSTRGQLVAMQSRAITLEKQCRTAWGFDQRYVG